MIYRIIVGVLLCFLLLFDMWALWKIDQIKNYDTQLEWMQDEIKHNRYLIYVLQFKVDSLEHVSRSGIKYAVFDEVSQSKW